MKPIQPEALLEAARDDRFRRISLVEYRRVSAWVKSMVDLNTARILDFGCGQGIAAASFAFRHPGSSVVGYDLSDVGVDWLRRLFQQQTGHPLPANLGFAQNGPGAIEPGSIDLIYAWSVLEHVDPDLLAETLSLLHRCLKPGGALFVSCDPLYYSPNGSHLYRYINSPWHHLLMSGDQLRRAVVTERARDADLREWQQFLSLNRITAPALTAALEQAGFTIQKRHVTRTDTPIPPALTAIFHEDVLRTSSVQLLAVPRAGAGGIRMNSNAGPAVPLTSVSTMEQPGLYTRAAAFMADLDGASGRLETALNEARTSPLLPEPARGLAQTLAACLASAMQAAPLMVLLAENPSLFRLHPHDGLDKAWRLRRRWRDAMARLATVSEAAEKLLLSMPAPLAVQAEAAPAPKPLSARDEVFPGGASGDFLLQAAAWFARRHARLALCRALPDGEADLGPLALPVAPAPDSAAGPDESATRARRRRAKPAATQDGQTLLLSRLRAAFLFDESYYRAQHAAAAASPEALVHYLAEGWRLGLDPSPLFSTRFYLRLHGAHLAPGQDPLSHYLLAGSADWLDPHPLFVTRHYAAQAGLTASPAETWLGAFLAANDARISPSPVFDPAFYAAEAGLTRRHAVLSLLHYLVFGHTQGVAPSPLFSPAFYAAQLPPGAVTGEPYGHYLAYGVKRLLAPHPLFDPVFYRAARPSLAEACDPLLDYLLAGEASGIAPSAFFDPGFFADQIRPGQGPAGALRNFLAAPDPNLDPCAGFSSAAYRRHFMPATATRHPHPILHFLEHGPQPPRRAVQARLPVALPRPVRFTERPSPAIPSALLTPLNYKQFPGKRPYRPGQPHVLLVAHVAAELLFGSERSLLDMLDGLLAVPANVFVVLPRNIPVYTNAIREKAQFVTCFAYDWWRRDTPASAPVEQAFAALIESLGIDAVHVNTIMLREPLSAARAARVPSIVHVREAITHDEALTTIIGETPEQIMASVHARADWIIGNSRFTGEMFAKAGHSFVIPNTLDLGDFDIPAPEPTNPVRFGLISSNIPKKGLDDVVTLARAVETDCPQAEFHLIGPITKAVEAIRDAPDAPANLRFPGYAKSPRDATASVDVVLNFSHFAESFGRTVLEAMAAARPVIAYAWGALPELISHGKTGYLVPHREPALAAPFVRELCRAPALIRALGEQGRAIARATYGLESYGRQFAHAYERILPPPVEIDRGQGPIVRPARDASVRRVEAPARVAYFCWHFPVPSETFVLCEIASLLAQGVDVIVFCRQIPHRNFDPGVQVAFERVETPAKLAQRLRETNRTIVHAHFTYPTVTDMVWPACEAAQIPFTFIAHAQDIFRADNDARNRLGEIGASPWCRRLFTLSRFHAEFVAARGFPREKIVINPNAVDTARFAEAAIEGRENRPFRRILAVHRFVEKKGLALLIQAAALIADLNVHIDIYGYGDLRASYEALIAELGLSNVTVHGQLAQAEVVAAMRGADLFACPAVRAENGDMDGIPTSLVESMAAGLPVLATSISGIPDLVADGISGFLAEPDPDSLAAAIRRFYAMPSAELAGVIETARTRAVQNHDVTRLTRVLRRVWENRATDIVIVAWNNLPELRAVVAHVLQNTALPFHLIVCDNDSRREPVPQFLETLWLDDPRVTVIHNDRNAMVGPGTNAAMAQGNADTIIYICGKEGFSFARGWEVPFIHAMAEDERIGLCGTIGRSPSYMTGADYPKGIRLFDKFRRRDFARDNPDRMFGHVQGGLFAIRRRMVDEIGGFSDDVPHDYTDVEYSYYAEACGWTLAEAPGVLALFNKSRPTLSQRMDETILVAHPVHPPELRRFAALRDGRLRHCNICDWYGEAFAAANLACPSCQSLPQDRSLFRWLADGPYMFRRLPAVCVGLTGEIGKVWATQFQGPHLPPDAFAAQLADHGRLKNAANAMHLAVFASDAAGAATRSSVATELARLLKPQAPLLVMPPDDTENLPDLLHALDASLGQAGFTRQPDIRFSSSAVRFSRKPIAAYRRD